jgi:hypothetical protein
VSGAARSSTTTDPVGYAAIERPIHPHDLHATVLHALGIDQHRLIYVHNNRKELVTVTGGEVIGEVFACGGSRGYCRRSGVM